MASDVPIRADHVLTPEQMEADALWRALNSPLRKGEDDDTAVPAE